MNNFDPLLMQLGIALFAITMISLYLGSIFLVAKLIFGPFREIMRRPAFKGFHFQLTDILALFIPFQIGYGAVEILAPDIRWNVPTTIGFVLPLAAITGLAWFYGLRLIWRMGFVSWLQRIVLLGWVMPATFVMAAIWFPVICASMSILDLILRIAGSVILIGGTRLAVFWILRADISKHQSTRDAGPSGPCATTGGPKIADNANWFDYRDDGDAWGSRSLFAIWRCGCCQNFAHGASHEE